MAQVALGLAEKKKSLQSLSPQWQLGPEENRLVREFKFKNFKEALAFTNAVGEVAEKKKHHPDLRLGWGYCRVEILTHTLNDLAAGDFELAKLIDAIAPASQS